MSDAEHEHAILTTGPQENEDMQGSQDSEITAFSEINIEPFQKQYINGHSTPISALVSVFMYLIFSKKLVDKIIFHSVRLRDIKGGKFELSSTSCCRCSQFT